jgi:thioester reductase-like protein
MEGADNNQPSEIINFYRNKSIFITGATGFLGKVLIEKLLRSCYDLKKIYVLVRHKKGNTPAQRLNELVNCQLFEMVSQYYPEFRSKLEAIEGDMLEPNMGISSEDEKKIIENVNIVFHSAATVRFDEPLK